VKSIVIVGGGSAGWMTAAILIKTFPEKNITLIESDSIPRVGVGESTYEGINTYLEYLGIDRESFFSYTNASIKLAIQFRNFYKESGEPDFIYPFGKPVTTGTFKELEDWLIRKSLNKDLPVTDFAESYFPSAHLVKHNTLTENKDGLLPGFNQVLNTALHFDATLFANWLKEYYCIPRGVNHIVSTVENINQDNSGIKSLLLENKNEIIADLFIDCTGFQSLLLDKALNEEFISYTDVLPNTNAWATQIEYKDPSVEVENVTRCTALKNGWCWNIPLFSRLGAGYVYSDMFTTHEDALEEFKLYLASELKIPRTSDEIEKLEIRNIKMRVGIHKRTWVKNVVAIGLSAGFIEPLESNGLFTVHEFLFHLIKSLQREKISQWDRDVYNDATKKTYDKFVEFIRLHYALSIRDDSEYWKFNLNRKFDFSKTDDQYESHLSITKELKMNKSWSPTYGGISWITAGMNYFLIDSQSIKISEIKEGKTNNFRISSAFTSLDNKKTLWNSYALECENSYQYLKRKYHSE
jgi:hypothetical protein